MQRERSGSLQRYWHAIEGHKGPRCVRKQSAYSPKQSVCIVGREGRKKKKKLLGLVFIVGTGA